MADSDQSLVDYCKQLEPLFIWAPTTRCGTTLLQRLITSSDELIVYGEFEYYAMDLINIFTQLTRLKDDGQFDEDRKRYADGELDFWCPHLKPDTEQLQQSVAEHFYRITTIYENTAREDGFERWGLKNPHFPEESLEPLRMLLPRSKHLFIIRNPYDVAESQKGRGWISSIDELRETARNWNQNVQGILNQYSNDDRSLIISFNDLIEDQSETVERLEQYLDIEGIDQSVFKMKVNNWAEQGDDPEQYVEPKQLTPEEDDIITEETRDGRSRR